MNRKFHFSEMYSSRGEPHFPARGKRPAVPGWQTYEATSAKNYYWHEVRGENIAFRTGERIVFDLDGKEAVRWALDHGIPLDTGMVVQSGGGNDKFHVHFRCPEGLIIRN